MHRQQLNAAIGRTLDYLGTRCQVIEVIDTAQGPCLILQDAAQRDIQADRHGEAHRRVPRTHSVPVTIDGAANPALAALWHD